MRRFLLLLLAVTGIPACVVDPAQVEANVSLKEARAVSDSFMTDLVNDRVDLALDKMEAEFVESLGRREAEAAIRKLFEYCGRPLDQEFKHDEIGAKVDLSHGKRPIRKFYYAATTSMHSKGTCFFGIEVVPAKEGLKVGTFGPLTLKSGELPDWLR